MLPFPDAAGGIAEVDAVGLGVFADDGAEAELAAGGDLHAIEDEGARGDPGVVLDDDAAAKRRA